MGRWIESCPNGLTAAELGDAVEALATTKAKVFAALRRVRRGTRAHARPSRSDELADG